MESLLKERHDCFVLQNCRAMLSPASIDLLGVAKWESNLVAYFEGEKVGGRTLNPDLPATFHMVQARSNCCVSVPADGKPIRS
ncbi:hypothetical protein Nepgr_024859 [Nepenthes gracilis]|uniref:Uncharacterized protein n=1 Tax=Nepenthes gracilis TaxID=150966 RepID=A0AAD3T6Q1_NEPGR|nr:hypothetical protein Nepgr_024859 [Nepenthes gracilis]